MKILYFGQICDDELFREKQKQKLPFFIAQFLYEKALLHGLKATNDVDIKVISIYQTSYFPKDKLVFNRKINEGHNYLKFINLPYLRELTYFISTFMSIFIWFLKNRKEKDKIIYSSCHFPPVSLAIVLAGKILSIKKLVTFTDLSLFSYSKERIKNMKFYKKLFIKQYIKLVEKLQKSYDAYILFAEEMKQVVNPKKKPYLIVEGIYNNENLNLTPCQRIKAIAHAGTLNKEVGIDKILDVFGLIRDRDLELWLLGEGDMTEEIIKRARLDKRIKYFGFQSRDIVFEKLKSAKLLVNFRNPNDAYTKYSFPSKTFEYMVSGTPFLTTKLKGIPDKYDEFLYYAESLEPLDIAKKIEGIISKPPKELEEKGKAAREFILQNKTSQVQSKKIVEFMKHLV